MACSKLFLVKASSALESSLQLVDVPLDARDKPTKAFAGAAVGKIGRAELDLAFQAGKAVIAVLVSYITLSVTRLRLT